MRTRTLLLLAVGCGLAILAAGVAQLVRVAGREDPPAAAVVGDAIRVGDLTIVVESLTEDAGEARVVVELGGVDDPDGTDDFRLVVPGESLPPNGRGGDAGGAPPCAGTTVGSQRCTLAFDVGSTTGSSRVLLYRRGDEQVRWELAVP